MAVEEIVENTPANKKKMEITEVEPKVVLGQPDNVEPPEVTEYAGFWVRFGARAVDGLIYVIVSAILAYAIVYPIMQNMLGVSEADIQKNSSNVAAVIQSRSENSSFTELLSSALAVDCDELFSDKQDQKQLCDKVDNYLVWVNGVSSSLIFVLSVAYFAFLTVSPWQGTVGKKLFKLRVVTSEGKKISILQSFARESLWIAAGLTSLLSIFYQPFTTISSIVYFAISIDAVVVLFNEKRQAFHDNLADTYVIRQSDTF